MAGPGPGGPGGPTAKGYSHPNSPHPSHAHMTPDHAYPDQDNGGKMMSYAPTPTYRSVEWVFHFIYIDSSWVTFGESVQNTKKHHWADSGTSYWLSVTLLDPEI